MTTPDAASLPHELARLRAEVMALRGENEHLRAVLEAAEFVVRRHEPVYVPAALPAPANPPGVTSGAELRRA